MQEFIITSPEQLKLVISEAVRTEMAKLPFAQQTVTPDNEQANNILTREAAAEYFHISLPTLNSYTKSGLLKGYRLGNRVFYKRSELEAAPSAIRTTRNSITQNQRRA